MTYFLKGNYELSEKPDDPTARKDEPKTLTERFEESVLAKLGGSLCFVMKGKTLLWTGDSSEETGE
ncbi:MAG: hypothetical protein ACE5Q6_18090 [Dehalococcoidia bacterium]